MKLYDVIIIGGGPAGISAGIYALRAGASVLVFDNKTSALLRAKHIQNYFGVQPTSGKELYEIGQRQFKDFGGTIKKQEVLQIINDFESHTYTIVTAAGKYNSKTVILATGAGKKKTPQGLEAYENANVSYCAVCDGFFYRGKMVAVIGSGAFALTEALELANNAKKVYLIGKSTAKSAVLPKNIEVIQLEPASFKGKDKVQKIVLENGAEIKVDGVFVAMGSLSGVEVAKQLGIILNGLSIVVDSNMMTNLPGVFAAGDIVGGLLQVSKAVSDGARAGLEAVRYIKTMEADGEDQES